MTQYLQSTLQITGKNFMLATPAYLDVAKMDFTGPPTSHHCQLAQHYQTN